MSEANNLILNLKNLFSRWQVFLTRGALHRPRQKGKEPAATISCGGKIKKKSDLYVMTKTKELAKYIIKKGK